jgi:glycyl-tRNA synthetase
LIEHAVSFDLREAVQKAAKIQPVEVKDAVQVQILEFIAGRLKVVLNDMGYRYDVVDAVLAEQGNNPARAVEAVKQLQGWVAREEWDRILPGYARCVRIIRSASVDKEKLKVNPGKFIEEEEKGLYQALQTYAKTRPADVDAFLTIVVALIPAINAFFDKVLVMAEDASVRQNRLGLVGEVAGLARGLADLSKLEGF